MRSSRRVVRKVRDIILEDIDTGAKRTDPNWAVYELEDGTVVELNSNYVELEEDARQGELFRMGGRD